jgi:hypothetical protein
LRRSPPASNLIQPHAKADLDVEELAEIRLMVDGAMRLAIHGLSKSCNGLKVKANTFRSGLANTAPCLWRPGYLAVRRRRRSLSIPSDLTWTRHCPGELTSYLLSAALSAT